MKSRSIYLTVVAFILTGTSLWAQAGSPPAGRGTMQRDPLARLDRILQASEAESLSAAQRQRITQHINDFRTAHQNVAPDSALLDAKRDLEEAILAGNANDVDAAATALSAEISRGAARIISELGRFQIQVLQVLSPGQVTAIKTKYGTTGLVHTLASLAGGWHGKMGRGVRHGMGPGMIGPGNRNR